MKNFETLGNFLTIFDIIYLIITLFSLLKCTRQGFVLSILVASKWLLAYVITLFLFPKFKPYVNDLLDNEFILDILLGISIFVVVIFVILLLNRSLGRAIKYTGLGSIDKFFGFFFGFIRGYVIAVCIYSTINLVYNFERWPINLNKSFSFPWVEKGGNYLIKEFPSQKEHNDAKEKIENI
tara:strand:+ start:2025 stop:2567 length:543 start_codon:yes stop_codon:yes gene_type:complete